MTTPNIVDTAVEAYRLVFAHRGDWARVAVVPVVIAAALGVAGGYLGSLLGGFPGSLVGMAFAIAAAVFSFCVPLAWFRAVHSGFTRVGQVLPLAPSRHERHFLIWAVAIGVLPGAIIGLIFGAVSTSGIGMIGGSGLLGFIVALCVLVIAVRLSFFFEDLALEKNSTPGTSFNQTGPHFPGILGGVVLVIIPVVVTLMILGLLLVPLVTHLGIFGSAIFQLATGLVGSIGAVLAVCVVNTFYRAA